MSTELLLIVRRPPGRGHLFRFRVPLVTAGADPRSGLHLPGAPFEIRFERREGSWWVIDADGSRPVRDADAIEVGAYLIEIALGGGVGPTTGRNETDRLGDAIDAERRVRASDGPSLWVVRGPGGGRALPIPADGALTCGSGPDDALALVGEEIEPGHLCLTAIDRGRVKLTARAPVRVRGAEVRDTILELGDLVFAGRSVVEIRTPGDEGELPVGVPGWARRRRWGPAVAAALFALALAALGVAWWGWESR